MYSHVCSDVLGVSVFSGKQCRVEKKSDVAGAWVRNSTANILIMQEVLAVKCHVSLENMLCMPTNKLVKDVIIGCLVGEGC